MHDMGNHNMVRSAAKSLAIVREFHSAWKMVTLEIIDGLPAISIPQ